jgi:hypothetical protein
VDRPALGIHAWSDLQPAIRSLTGGPGSYSRSQTYSKSTEATIGFPTGKNRTGVYYRSYFRYAKWAYYYCDPSVGCQLFAFRVKPYSWERGVNYVSRIPAPRVKKSHCSHYAAGGSDTSRGSKAITWTDGVLITGGFRKVVGASLDLSSQTGFTSSAENRVLFKRRGWLCGIFGPLSSKPGALLARRW